MFSEEVGLHRFKSLRFLLVDSQVARDTKALVTGVAAKKAAVGPILLHPLSPFISYMRC